jgi:hypothetical protein
VTALKNLSLKVDGLEMGARVPLPLTGDPGDLEFGADIIN